MEEGNVQPNQNSGSRFPGDVQPNQNSGSRFPGDVQPNQNSGSRFPGDVQPNQNSGSRFSGDVQPNLNSGSRFPGVNLYVKNLDDSINDEILYKHFSVYGTITSAKVMTKGIVSKGFGFVCFKHAEEASKAIAEMNGRLVGSKPLYVSVAQKKEDRKAHFATQFSSQRPQFQGQGTPQQFGQVAPTPDSGYFVPVMTHGQQQQTFYAPNTASNLVVTPRWQTPPGQPAVGYYAPNQTQSYLPSAQWQVPAGQYELTQEVGQPVLPENQGYTEQWEAQ